MFTNDILSNMNSKLWPIKDSYTFDNHKDLDRFVHAIIGVDAEFENNYEEEFQLLKAFDR
jgi:hypothetical protein